MADEKNIGTPAEEEIEIITLTDENGEDMDFEFLDLVEYEGKRYAVLLPPVEDVEGEDENEDEEVLILQVEDDGNEENESYVFVDDDDILTAVFDIFKEKGSPRCKSGGLPQYHASLSGNCHTAIGNRWVEY